MFSILVSKFFLIGFSDLLGEPVRVLSFCSEIPYSFMDAPYFVKFDRKKQETYL